MTAAPEVGCEAAPLPSRPPRRVVQVHRAGVDVRLSVRSIVVVSILTVLACVSGVLALRIGDYPMTLSQVLSSLVGQQDGFVQVVVVEWRLPRALAAVVFGAALGISGAMFQCLTRNPLGSPDIIGFSTGSYTGALLVIIFAGGGFYAVAAGSLVGGLLTAVAVYFFAYKRGVSSFRLIIIGIGFTAMLNAFNTFLLMRAQREVAMTGAAWGAGSLNGIAWEQIVPVSVPLLAAFAGAVMISRPMHATELGDDAASALGVPVERTRALVVLVAVALTALVTAIAGPIAFVALAAPQLARRLTRSPGVTLVPAAAMGALLLSCSDLLAQNLLQNLPVGIVTVCIGGLYLIWLLVAETRRRAGRPDGI